MQLAFCFSVCRDVLICSISSCFWPMCFLIMVNQWMNKLWIFFLVFIKFNFNVLELLFWDTKLEYPLSCTPDTIMCKCLWRVSWWRTVRYILFFPVAQWIFYDVFQHQVCDQVFVIRRKGNYVVIQFYTVLSLIQPVCFVLIKLSYIACNGPRT